jgi:hypothetical protein
VVSNIIEYIFEDLLGHTNVPENAKVVSDLVMPSELALFLISIPTRPERYLVCPLRSQSA